MADDKTQAIARGLEGVVVAETRKSYIDGEKGILLYQGIPIEELAENARYEEVVYLLWYGELPTWPQLDEFKKKLVGYRAVPASLLDAIRAYPKSAHPMAALRTAVSSLGMYDPQAEVETPEANLEKALQLTAGIPTLIAAHERSRRGQAPVAPRSDLDHTENFLYMLHGEIPSDAAVQAVDTYLVLLADHGFNASTFTARVITATLADMYSAVTGAIGALKGPLHGGANQRAMEMFMEIGEPERAEDYVRQALENHQRIMGVGHRVYKTLDPRARILRERSEALAAVSDNRKMLDVAMAVADVVAELLGPKGIWPNVDFYSGPVLHAAGIPVDQFTSMFVMSRIAGWAAHIMEQQEDNRLIRPRARYVGPMDRHYVPINQRG